MVRDFDEVEVSSIMTEVVADSMNINGVDCDVQSFKDAGVMTLNEGFVMTFSDGKQFQITVVES